MKRILFKILNKLITWHEFYNYEIMRKKYNLPQDFGFNGKLIKFHGEGNLIIGKKCYVGSFTSFQLEKDFYIKIGNNCSISHNVRIYTSSKIPDYSFEDKKSVPERKANVEIGNYVWIGANVFINPGVKIGDNSVIGANSVVTKDILPNGIYAGTPAKLIRMKKYI